MKKLLFNRRGEASAHTIYAIAFTVIAVVALVMLGMLLSGSEADNSTQDVTVSNAVPVVESVATSITSDTDTAGGFTDDATITPTESDLTVYIHGEAHDDNGCNDFDTASNWKIGMARTTIGMGNCDEVGELDNNNCYAVNSSSDLALSGCTGAGDTDLIYEGQLDLKHYADATDSNAPTHSATTWTAGVTAVDENSGESTQATDTFEMATFKSLDLSGNIAYGSLAVTDLSAEKSVTVTNKGNVPIDADISAGGDMTCDGDGSSDIGVAQTEWSLTSGFTHSTNGTDMGTSAGDVQMSLAQQTTDGTDTTDVIYFRLQMPDDGVRGTCTNTVTISATTDD